MLAVIVNQMKDQMVPKSLQKRVRQHVEYDWLRNRGHSLKDLLQHVPYCLRLSATVSSRSVVDGRALRDKWKLLMEDKTIPLSQHSPGDAEPAFLGELRAEFVSCAEKVLNFKRGDYRDFITKRGDIGRRVYIIRRGSVLVYRTSPAEPEYFLYSGSIYGDVQMVYPTIPYEHHLVADYPSDVLVIHQADIQLLLADNPQFFFRLVSVDS
ncbi:hypothetical protein FJT64_021192 [Amphibalanus amphitrite]|uniref:Cyclic nucleotide-binding domain-containing protein n=1 Tax=Amphibalanus amphitrite TaxID=1232801 RepID=A0A6A4WUI7_AMPAM|nr:hypothetical protein FJT64_021192 [Amphibalanus amphitrite]